jgi:hypothetical protein
MRYLVKKLPGVRFLAIGGYPKNFDLHRYSLDKYFIQTELIVDDDYLIKLYYSFDILAHSSSIGESYGQTIAEAMAACRPIVVNSTSYANNAQIELVDNGVTGFVANSPKSYAEAVEHIIHNKNVALRFGQNGLEKACKFYDANIITKTLEKILIEVLERKVSLPSEITEYAKKIQSPVSSQDIINYRKEYEKRLRNNFRQLTLSERVQCELRYYWTIRSLKREVEDKLSKLFYVKKSGYTPLEKLYTK